MKIALLGYGKMGKTIEKLAIEKGHIIVYRINSTSDKVELSEADIAIEFSSPEVAVKHISTCFNQNVPIVCGTTGWLAHYDEILKKCKMCNGSFIYASNFSVGVNLFFELNLQLAKMMAKYKDYLVSIEEIHHTQKKDAPSGTAITLAEGIIKNSNYNKWQLNEVGKMEIPITAKRMEEVKGTHSIFYTSPIDTISIKHEAHSRDGFALGAILAAEWLLGKKGVFTMKEVLDL
ncbi:MAG: 4-hydroxy-tetrahydrodipicolinate reductase [Bacteroidetes bacterium HGW-Bacteroidetes-2]|jgi:4-hydroxy-tetrahydrodipicolinate reductase|nr:MAG: 4-hydroxy-tetrahydrodipicolinate reductase [Bacteroidetes bacterium HGW-Bacteroidetes-8]PKP26776.1 MAG: 4-hydroxy-tetrahydrodipicolinate reductase [Bacteroidetes bacterium HGW-Bacteroidetes-2]